MIAFCGATVALLLVPASAALATGTAVAVRVEGTTHTLLSTVVVHTHDGSITQGATPSGDCPATTAAGALDVATRHRWAGKFYSRVPGIFITPIFGEKPAGHDYWTIFVNNRAASAGICSLKLPTGDQLLFADTNGSENPLILTAPQHATIGRPFRVEVSYDTPKLTLSASRSGYIRSARVTVRVA